MGPGLAGCKLQGSVCQVGLSQFHRGERQEGVKLAFFCPSLPRKVQGKRQPQVSSRGTMKIKLPFCTNTFSFLFLLQPQVTDGFQLITCTVILPLSPATVTTSPAQIFPPGCNLLAVLDGFSFLFNVRAELWEGIKYTERNKQLKRLFIF